jgi:hypothetical protein
VQLNPATNSDSKTRLQGPSQTAVRLKWARKLHLYLGTLFAPSIIFFAFTGAFQLFGLHNSHPGAAHQPPAWVQEWASIHMQQTVPEKHVPPPALVGEQKRSPEARRPPQPPEGGQQNHERETHKFTLALKWFFLATTVGLTFSSVLGIYMAFKFNRSRALIWGLLILGTAIPVALIVMMA